MLVLIFLVLKMLEFWSSSVGTKLMKVLDGKYERAFQKATLNEIGAGVFKGDNDNFYLLDRKATQSCFKISYSHCCELRLQMP